MSQQLSFWYKALDLQIPRTASMEGGIYLWKDGREVPDTMSVDPAAARGDSDQLGFGCWQQSARRSSEDVLGTHGSISRASQVRYVPQKVNRPSATEMTGRTAHTPQAHMQNFFDCIRSGKEPNCPFDLGYRVSVACRMAVDSYRTGRALRWDAVAGRDRLNPAASHGFRIHRGSASAPQDRPRILARPRSSRT